LRSKGGGERVGSRTQLFKGVNFNMPRPTYLKSSKSITICNWVSLPKKKKKKEYRRSLRPPSKGKQDVPEKEQEKKTSEQAHMSRLRKGGDKKINDQALNQPYLRRGRGKARNN